MVTVVFADVVGFTKMTERYDPETLTEMMNRLFERFSGVVRRYEGVVDKFIGDAAMILFGAPVAHEDDAERAVQTARDLVGLLPAVNEQLRIEFGTDPEIALHVGVATGLVIAGSIGLGGEGGYTVMGDAVNVAARLVDLAAPGEILVSESTLRLVRGRVRTERVQTVQVKGKEEPVTVFRVTGLDATGSERRLTSGFFGPLVGRERELSELRAAFLHLAEGSGCLVALEGAAGVGKSRLVRECLEGELPGGIVPRVALGRCISYGRSVPYYPWSQVLGSLLTESLLHRLKGDQLQVLQQVATGAFGNRPPAEAEKHHETVFQSVAMLLEAASVSTPRVIILEDMHWADPTSVELLSYLVKSPLTARILIIAAFRPTGGDLRARIRDSAANKVYIDLPPLSLSLARRLVDELTGNEAGLGEKLRDEIAFRSEGIPLFVEEILRHYVEQGLLVRVEGGWHFHAPAGSSAPSVPASLHSLLASKIDRLGARDRARLELASVRGTAFDPRFIDTLLTLPYDSAAWKKLEESGEIVVSPDPAGRSGLYRFAHALTQEVIYGTLLRVRRQELHLAIATALEGDPQAREEDLHSLAWHFEQASRPEKAAAYWLAAAHQAAGVYANSEALELYDRALAAAPNASAAHESLFAKGELLQSMGRTAEAAGAVDRLIEIAAAERNLAREADLLARRAYLAYQVGDGPGILTYAERSLERARESGDRRVVARSLRQIGIAHEFSGRFAPAERAYRELLSIEESHEDSELASRTYNSLGEMARAAERYEEALSWYEKSGAGHRKMNPQKPNFSYLNNVGAAYVGLGQHSRAEVILSECITERERTGYVSFLSESYFYRGLARLGMERLEEAAADAERALELAERHQESEMLGLALRLTAVLQEAGANVGEGADPSANLRESIRILQGSGKRIEEARSRWDLARILRKKGREEEAAWELDRARRIFSDLGLEGPARRIEAETATI